MIAAGGLAGYKEKEGQLDISGKEAGKEGERPGDSRRGKPSGHAFQVLV
jgi:hypothetical protein